MVIDSDTSQKSGRLFTFPRWIKMVAALTATAVVCFCSGIVIGSTTANRARCREIAVQIADALYSGTLQTHSRTPGFFSDEASSRFSERRSKLGVPSEYRITDVRQGPFGLPTIVYVTVKRGQKTYDEEVIMQGVGFVDEIK